ncbi:monooxygenase [Gordonia sp. LSe1-13]|uniref:Monooxygenase n=1 Tax=Gordonia sesuvii TaxID=3116777 RepID=A0ABU7MGU2_9ACTN|nr:monooxygenase [Gordonia sp. LSe1-13]
MTSVPVVELRVWGVDRIGPALGRMAFGRRRIGRLPGLRFAKLLGTGSARTFTPRDADLRHWALLTVWEDDAAATAGGYTSAIGDWMSASTEELRVRMRPLRSRGRWAGVDPFGSYPEAQWDGQVAAITRARLRPTRAMSFWRAVPPVVSELSGAAGLQVAFGIGEAPIGLQGTFSLWESADRLTEFAYRSPAHVAAVRRTDSARWYAEELFARLAVTDVTGRYLGRTP